MIMIIRSTPPATDPAMMYIILLSFSVGNGARVVVVVGADVVVVVSAKSVCTLEMLALMALDILATEF